MMKIMANNTNDPSLKNKMCKYSYFETILLKWLAYSLFIIY